MNSIKASLSELQQCYDSLSIARACLCGVAGDLGQSIVLLDDGTTTTYRERLAEISEEIDAAPVATLPDYRVAVRNLLAAYHDRVTDYVAELKEDRTRTQRALEDLAASLAQADDDHDGRIRTTVDTPRTISRSPDGKNLRDVLRVAADAIERSVEQIRTQHQITIAQFTREIRALERQLDPSQAERGLGSWSRVFDQPQIEEVIRSAKLGESWLCILRVKGLRLAASIYGADVAVQLAGAFVVRLRNLLPTQTAIARWAEEEYLALIPRSASSGSVSSTVNRITEKIPGPYACAYEDGVVHPAISLNVCMLNDTTCGSADLLLEQVSMSFRCI